ncbi:EF-hand domain-containing protein [Kineosporia succinea]|uniref:Ca2+-binding EF-hand superfamily protein n=1 Tax=Kineosporia succinea TaxID=84632 RepID=A0ABT9P643_9ACTN|nr:EF-hand domain-containing protein [Kineosporia succinea]MDP9828132.1 Ca2+-binding EF-hand superfamily protein [Kineosporia succinea]
MTENVDYKATFDLIDADGDGLITAVELKNLMTALGSEVSDEMAQHAVTVIDADGDGLVSLPELADYLGENAPRR